MQAFLLFFNLVILLTSSVSAQGETKPIRKVHDFNDGRTSIGSVTARENGVLILALNDRPELYAIDPLTRGSTPQLILRFKNAVKINGVTELGGDTVAVLVQTERSTSLFNVTFPNRLSSEVQTSRVGAPFTNLKNMTSLTIAPPESVLACDPSGGKVYRIMLADGSIQPVLEDPAMAGIEDIDIYDNTLWFTSRSRGVLARVPVDPGTYKATGPVEMFVEGIPGMKGFGFASYSQGQNGAVIVVNNEKDEVLSVDMFDKSVRTIAYVPGMPTNVAAGGTEQDANTMYVVTAKGGLFSIETLS